MKFEEEFPSLEYEGIDGEECHMAYNQDRLFYRETDIQKHCLDKAKVKEAIEICVWHTGSAFIHKDSLLVELGLEDD